MSITYSPDYKSDAGSHACSECGADEPGNSFMPGNEKWICFKCGYLGEGPRGQAKKAKEAMRAGLEAENARLRALVELAKEVVGEEWNVNTLLCTTCGGWMDLRGEKLRAPGARWRPEGHTPDCKRARFFAAVKETNNGR